MKKSKSQKTEVQNEARKDLAKKSQKKDFLIVGIGASAGGVQALKTFFENVPADSGAAYVVILHLSPDHDSQLAEVLQKVAPIPVKQVKEKILVEPNHVYVVPPNESLLMSDGHIVVSPIHTVEERRAPVDIFFRTLGESHCSRAVAVVLSGTGANGSMGIKRVKENGGAAFVQNPREAEFSEMPRNSIATELIDEILNVSEIPAKIVAYGENLGKIVIPIEPEHREEEQQAALREIFTSLRVRTGHDFTNYKRASVLRRIERRINVRNLQSLPAYTAYLKENPDEINALLKDLLISVTNFFRDKEAFDYLEREIVPRILLDKKSGDQIRLWVAGCATGEEAYSTAMLLAEKIDGKLDAPTIQIFATDIDEAAIAAARAGFYTLNDAADVSPERLRRFFTQEKNGYRIRRELREMILFANHNLLKDPPFSRLDLATCRNLLIYFNNAAQERAMETFHFALKPGGYLFLGSSESVDGAGDLYAPINREQRVFQSRQTAPRISYPVPDLSPSFSFDRSPPIIAFQENKIHSLERISYGDLHQEILEQYAPPSMIVNEQFDIVHVSPQAGRYLQISGEVSKNLFKLIRPELRLELSTAVYQAVERQTSVRAKNLKVRINDSSESVNVSVRPVLRRNEDAARGFILIIFEQTADAPDAEEEIFASPESVARHLEEALLHSQSQYRHSVEQSEVQAEELRASNEELQAINEELRSATEELETGKEELQSVNEELMTVNQELKIKIEELSLSNNDLQNLINSTSIGTIFLDRSLHVKLFTPTVREVFNLIDADINRPLADITTKLDFADLQTDVEMVLKTLRTVERELETDAGKWFLMRVFPYRTAEDKISGVVITFVDITNRKKSEEKLSQSEKRFRAIVNQAAAGIAETDLTGKLLLVNDSYQGMLGYSRPELLDLRIEDITHPDDFPRNRALLEKLYADGEPFEIEKRYVGKNGETIWVCSNVAVITDAADRPLRTLIVSIDITQSKHREQELRESEARYSQLLTSIDEGFAVIEMIFDENERAIDYRFLEANPAFANQTGLTAVVGKTARELVPNLEEFWFEIYGKVVKTGESRRFEHEVKALNLCLDIFASRVGGADSRKVAVVFQDITERKLAEEAVRESEERLRLIISSVEDYAIITTDVTGIINGWNPGAEKSFGYTEREIIGKPADLIFTPEDREKSVSEREMQTALETGRAEAERLHVRRDGSRFFASGVIQPLKDGKIDGFVKIVRDITERIKAEQIGRDKKMLQKLVGAQEDERRRIARDLHDELGQLLTGLRLKLESVRKLCEDNTELCGKVDETQVIAKHLDAGIDFLAWELRPAALDDLGLRAALAKYVSEWSHYAGVTAELLGSTVKKMRLAPEAETNLYRIAQESLNNVHKHAKAKSVELSLEKRDGDMIVLIIADDGKGFDPQDKMNRDTGIGLIGMRERAALIGGTLEIESAPGKGTTIFVRVPISSLKKENPNDE